MNHDGVETLLWRPLLKLSPGESVDIDCSLAEKGTLYEVVAEGIDSNGTPVYARKSFGL